MEGLNWRAVCLSALCVLLFLRPAAAIRFVIDREECFSHNVEYEGDTVHVSFVVIKAETPWHYSEEGVDLVVRDRFLFLPCECDANLIRMLLVYLSYYYARHVDEK